VDDYAVEACEDPPPEVAARGGTARQEVVCGEHGRRAEPEVDVHVRHGEPLDVQKVGSRERERAHHVEVLQPFQWQPQPRAAEEP